MAIIMNFALPFQDSIYLRRWDRCCPRCGHPSTFWWQVQTDRSYCHKRTWLPHQHYTPHLAEQPGHTRCHHQQGQSTEDRLLCMNKSSEAVSSCEAEHFVHVLSDLQWILRSACNVNRIVQIYSMETETLYTHSSTKKAGNQVQTYTDTQHPVHSSCPYPIRHHWPCKFAQFP